jgi:hypothetical protein
MLYYKTKWQEEVARLNVRVQEKFVEFQERFHGNLEVVEFHRNGNLEKVEEKKELKREFQEK